MSNKRYTAKEMREAASNCENVKAACQFYSTDMDRVAAMLRQAADMDERANERRGMFAANYGRVDYEVDSAIVDEIDYILRGDAGKEKR